MCFIRSRQCLQFAITIWLAAGVAATAQSERELFNQTRDGVEAEHGRFLEIAREVAFTTADEQPLTLREQPIMNWSNPARNGEVGSIFVWEAAGRPAVVGTVFTYGAFNKSIRTKLAVHSLSSASVQATLDGAIVWKPEQPGLVWHTASTKPEPAGAAALRLVRMRAIAREFKLTLSLPNKTTETLRLLPQPLYRYQSDAAKVVDGGIFGFVTATDPEALLFVEAVTSGNGIEWRYALARFHFAEIEAAYQGPAVWKTELEFDQRNNRLGDPNFQDRIYSTMLIGEHFPEPPQ
ncbi:MAG: hypothetical protein KDA75_01975 [Planctomycetaceae bacterium]|nr:hypothetical protein [Planctomycetaceae bacterium]